MYIIGFSESAGYYIMDRHGTPVAAKWFETYEAALDYAYERGYQIYTGDEED